MQTYRSSAVGNLAAQLRRAPARLRLRQLYGIEFVLSVIESGKSYPLDFVTHAITGFRARSASEMGDAQLVPADTIRGDLIALAEELSGAAEIAADRWPEAVHTVPELAKRLDVSTKTIFRWHRRGLIGWRFRFPDRRQRLAFPERSVRRFVSANAELVRRGSTFTQLSPTEREQIIERAKALVETGQRTVNAVAKVIAGESSRAVETIRLILKHYDDSRPAAGVFNRSNLRVDADDDRLKVWEAYNDGASVTSLAERFSRTPAEIYRVITEMRARELKARTIEFIAADEFLAPDADRIVSDAAAKNPYATGSLAKRPPSDLPPYLQTLFRIPLLSPAGEVALFRKLNYLKYKADRMRAALEPEQAEAAALDEIESLLSQADEVKNQIAQSNLRLVVSIAKRHLSPGQDFFELVSDGNVSLMRAVDRFDFTRGFKFSTYASWAIMKNFARTVPEARIHRDRYQTGHDEHLDALASVGPQESESDYLPAVRTAVEKMLSSLDEREREIMRYRYGLETGGEPQTLEQIGQRLGVSKERVRQLEARAVAKLREGFEGDVRHLLGGE